MEYDKIIELLQYKNRRYLERWNVTKLLNCYNTEMVH